MLYFIAKVRFNSLRYKYHFWCFYVLRNGHAMIKQSYHLACSSCWMAQTLSSMRFWITLCSASCQCSTSTATIIRGRRCAEPFETTYQRHYQPNLTASKRMHWAAFNSILGSTCRTGSGASRGHAAIQTLPALVSTLTETGTSPGTVRDAPMNIIILRSHSLCLFTVTC